MQTIVGKLNFHGIVYELTFPEPLLIRLRNDYGAFLCEDSQRNADFNVTINSSDSDRPQWVGSNLFFNCLGAGRENWEKCVRGPLSTHIAAQLFERHGFIRLHAGLINFDGNSILISGPSGAGKTSLCLALGAAAGSEYYAHEMVFADQAGNFIGWPQPLTLNPGTLAWLESSAIDKTNVLWVETDSPPGMKRLIGMKAPSPGPELQGIDFILFPERTPLLDGDRLTAVKRETAFTCLVSEVKYPISDDALVLQDPERYASTSIDVASRLSNVPAYKLAWHKDQAVSLGLIRQLIR